MAFELEGINCLVVIFMMSSLTLVTKTQPELTHNFTENTQHVQLNRCVDSCLGLKDGNYQDCQDCKLYVSCSNEYMYIMPCPSQLVWDDVLKRCEWTSSSCPSTKPGLETSNQQEATTKAPTNESNIQDSTLSTTLQTVLPKKTASLVNTLYRTQTTAIASTPSPQGSNATGEVSGRKFTDESTTLTTPKNATGEINTFETTSTTLKTTTPRSTFSRHWTGYTTTMEETHYSTSSETLESFNVTAKAIRTSLEISNQPEITTMPPTNEGKMHDSTLSSTLKTVPSTRTASLVNTLYRTQATAISTTSSPPGSNATEEESVRNVTDAITTTLTTPRNATGEINTFETTSTMLRTSTPRSTLPRHWTGYTSTMGETHYSSSSESLESFNITATAIGTSLETSNQPEVTTMPPTNEGKMHDSTLSSTLKAAPSTRTASLVNTLYRTQATAISTTSSPPGSNATEEESVRNVTDEITTTLTTPRNATGEINTFETTSTMLRTSTPRSTFPRHWTGYTSTMGETHYSSSSESLESFNITATAIGTSLETSNQPETTTMPQTNEGKMHDSTLSSTLKTVPSTRTASLVNTLYRTQATAISTTYSSQGSNATGEESVRNFIDEITTTLTTPRNANGEINTFETTSTMLRTSTPRSTLPRHWTGCKSAMGETHYSSSSESLESFNITATAIGTSLETSNQPEITTMPPTNEGKMHDSTLSSTLKTVPSTRTASLVNTLYRTQATAISTTSSPPGSNATGEESVRNVTDEITTTLTSPRNANGEINTFETTSTMLRTTAPRSTWSRHWTGNTTMREIHYSTTSESLEPFNIKATAIGTSLETSNQPEVTTMPPTNEGKMHDFTLSSTLKTVPSRRTASLVNTLYRTQTTAISTTSSPQGSNATGEESVRNFIDELTTTLTTPRNANGEINTFETTSTMLRTSTPRSTLPRHWTGYTSTMGETHYSSSSESLESFNITATAIGTSLETSNQPGETTMPPTNEGEMYDSTLSSTLKTVPSTMTASLVNTLYKTQIAAISTTSSPQGSNSTGEESVRNVTDEITTTLTSPTNSTVEINTFETTSTMLRTTAPRSTLPRHWTGYTSTMGETRYSTSSESLKSFNITATAIGTSLETSNQEGVTKLPPKSDGKIQDLSLSSTLQTVISTRIASLLNTLYITHAKETSSTSSPRTSNATGQESVRNFTDEITTTRTTPKNATVEINTFETTFTMLRTTTPRNTVSSNWTGNTKPMGTAHYSTSSESLDSLNITATAIGTSTESGSEQEVAVTPPPKEGKVQDYLMSAILQTSTSSLVNILYRTKAISTKSSPQGSYTAGVIYMRNFLDGVSTAAISQKTSSVERNKYKTTSLVLMTPMAGATLTRHWTGYPTMMGKRHYITSTKIIESFNISSVEKRTNIGRSSQQEMRVTRLPKAKKEHESLLSTTLQAMASGSIALLANSSYKTQTQVTSTKPSPQGSKSTRMRNFHDGSTTIVTSPNNATVEQTTLKSTTIVLMTQAATITLQRHWTDYPNTKGKTDYNVSSKIPALFNITAAGKGTHPPSKPFGENLYNSTIGCISSCLGADDGVYQFCLDCHHYVACSNEYEYIMPCPAELFWNDIKKWCDWTSSTCQLPEAGKQDEWINVPTNVCVDSCVGVEDGVYQYCRSCQHYVVCTTGYRYILPCPFQHFWDDVKKKCELTSCTCPPKM